MSEPATLGEKHFSIKELAAIWKLSPPALRRLFRNEPGVIRFGSEKKGHTRSYVTLRIPSSVAERVYCRCMRPGIPLDQKKTKSNV